VGKKDKVVVGAMRVVTDGKGEEEIKG
jgi:hypothetical protein